MIDDGLATSNVNRTYSLAATSIAIFTFMLIFLYPRYVSGDVNGLAFQATLVVMALAIFSFLLSAFHYYGASLPDRVEAGDRVRYAQRADRLWLLGITLLFLDPGLILFAIGLLVVAAIWLALWLVYLWFALRYFPRVQTARR